MSLNINSEDNNKKKLASKVKNIRKRQPENYTQEQFASILKLSQKTIESAEQGKHHVPMSYIIKLKETCPDITREQFKELLYLCIADSSNLFIPMDTIVNLFFNDSETTKPVKDRSKDTNRKLFFSMALSMLITEFVFVQDREDFEMDLKKNLTENTIMKLKEEYTLSEIFKYFKILDYWQQDEKRLVSETLHDFNSFINIEE